VSADNYYEIQPAPSGGGYVAVMGKLSTDGSPRLNRENPYMVYPSVELAVAAVENMPSEYGVTISDECEEPVPFLVIEFRTDGKNVTYDYTWEHIPDDKVSVALRDAYIAWLKKE
jgi:hypothetical protein